jgi:hypothetical protein
VEGFEPPNGGTKTRSLTTWRHPILKSLVSFFQKKPEKSRELENPFCFPFVSLSVSPSFSFSFSQNLVFQPNFGKRKVLKPNFGKVFETKFWDVSVSTQFWERQGNKTLDLNPSRPFLR